VPSQLSPMSPSVLRYAGVRAASAQNVRAGDASVASLHQSVSRAMDNASTTFSDAMRPWQGNSFSAPPSCTASRKSSCFMPDHLPLLKLESDRPRTWLGLGGACVAKTAELACGRCTDTDCARHGAEDSDRQLPSDASDSGSRTSPTDTHSPDLHVPEATAHLMSPRRRRSSLGASVKRPRDTDPEEADLDGSRGAGDGCGKRLRVGGGDDSNSAPPATECTNVVAMPSGEVMSTRARTRSLPSLACAKVSSLRRSPAAPTLRNTSLSLPPKSVDDESPAGTVESYIGDMMLRENEIRDEWIAAMRKTEEMHRVVEQRMRVLVDWMEQIETRLMLGLEARRQDNDALRKEMLLVKHAMGIAADVPESAARAVGQGALWVAAPGAGATALPARVPYGAPNGSRMPAMLPHWLSHHVHPLCAPACGEGPGSCLPAPRWPKEVAPWLPRSVAPIEPLRPCPLVTATSPTPCDALVSSVSTSTSTGAAATVTTAVSASLPPFSRAADRGPGIGSV